MGLPYEELNCNQLYVYNLSDSLLDSLEPVFFDSEAKIKPKPSDVQWQDLKQEVKNSDSIYLPPRIIYPKPRLESEEPSLNSIKELKIEDEDEDVELDSESENEEEIENFDDDNTINYLNSRSPYIYLDSKEIFIKSNASNQSQHHLKKLVIYKSIFDSQEITNPITTLKNWKTNYSISEPDISALFMIGGGHFVAAIVSHKPLNIKKFIKPSEASMILPQTVDIIAHKSFHRYTTRRKQGGSQSAMDDAKGKANSAGSSLRRYNEQALMQDVKDTIISWENYLKNCKSIFIKANNSKNFKLIVTGNDLQEKLKNKNKVFELYKNDPRIKKFPFTTNRPTIGELRKAWVALSYLTITNLPKIDTRLKSAKIKESQIASSKIIKPVNNETKVEKSLEDKQSTELINLLKKSKAPALIAYLRKQKLSVNFLLTPNLKYQKTPTLLHYAADNHLHHMVWILLNNLKADPTILSIFKKTAFDLVGDDKLIKYSFQKARFKLGENYCDWEKMGHMNVPGLSDEEIEEIEKNLNQEKLKEVKKIIDEEKKNVIKKPKSIGNRLTNAPSIDKQILSGLSEDDRRKLERERRARAAEARFKK